jgi:hypothetical protein
VQSCEQVIGLERLEQHAAAGVAQEFDMAANFARRAAGDDDGQRIGGKFLAQPLDEGEPEGIAIHVYVHDSGAAAGVADHADSFIDVEGSDGHHGDVFGGKNAFDEPDVLNIVIDHGDGAGD